MEPILIEVGQHTDVGVQLEGLTEHSVVLGFLAQLYAYKLSKNRYSVDQTERINTRLGQIQDTQTRLLSTSFSKQDHFKITPKEAECLANIRDLPDATPEMIKVAVDVGAAMGRGYEKLTHPNSALLPETELSNKTTVRPICSSVVLKGTIVAANMQVMDA
jgi:hypothetical protein